MTAPETGAGAMVYQLALPYEVLMRAGESPRSHLRATLAGQPRLCRRATFVSKASLVEPSRGAYGEPKDQGELHADYHEAFCCREHSAGRVESRQRQQRRRCYAGNLDRRGGQNVRTVFSQFC